MATGIIAVLVANLGILGYAVALHNGSGSQGDGLLVFGMEPPRTSVPGSGAARDPDLSSANAPTVTNTSTGARTLDPDGSDWPMEPLRVVNDLDLPSDAENREAFLGICAACHGPEGRGDGPGAAMLIPPPRDFIGSPFRYAATDADRAHIIDDLERTITQGVPRSAMPGFGDVLPERQIDGLAHYVLAIRERNRDDLAAADHVEIGERPPLTSELIDRGRELFTQLACSSCHGETGRGDGPNALGLVDFQGRPVRPADLSAGLFKTGPAPEDICRTIMRGVPGTPMVAYESILAQDNADDSVNTLDAWALVGFIRSLANGPAPRGIASGARLLAQRAPDDAMVDNPAHPAWLGVEPTRVALKPLQSGPSQPLELAVRVVHTDDRVALCLDWDDPTPDIDRTTETGADTVSVSLGLTDQIPPLPIGIKPVDGQSQAPTNIWRWRGDLQYDAVTGQRHESIVRDLTASRAWYLFVSGPGAELPVIGIAPDPGPAGAVSSDPIANAGAMPRAIEEANTEPDGSVSNQPLDGQSATATAEWANGRWRVLMVRPQTTNDADDAQFVPGKWLPLSFTIRNASIEESQGPVLISSWHWLSLSD